jgi:pyruvate dehydrogenase E2 component (dihydrolipoamide acetyltransferase)
MVPITVPRLGWSMEEGTFVEWLKQEGDAIRPGDALFVLESDKSSEQIEAIDAGILHIPADSPPPGTVVKVGQVLGYVLAQGEVAPGKGAEPHQKGEPGESATGETQARPPRLSPSVAHAPGSPRKRAISPRARRLARERGVDWTNLQGTGRNGRIRERDVAAVALADAAGRLIPHTTIRRTIAARMVAGATVAAPVTLTKKIDVSNLVNLRGQLLRVRGEDAPSYTDLIVKLTALALKQHPMLQAQWRDDGLFVPERIDIAVGVDSEAGLFAPVVRDADQRSLKSITANLREMIELARSGRMTAEQMRDATFTVTNLGMFGVDSFTPIIHLPQGAVLGVGRIVREPAVQDGAVVIRDVMTASLTFDHRVIDGAPAARFLETLGRSLTDPAPWLVS